MAWIILDIFYFKDKFIMFKSNKPIYLLIIFIFIIMSNIMKFFNYIQIKVFAKHDEKREEEKK
jgi:hypothetical protein